MKLGELATACGYGVSCNADAVVTGFAIDHRKVAPGTVFGAFQGATVNGEDFIPAAIAAGAIAVVARPEVVVGDAAHIADAQPRRAFAAPIGKAAFARIVAGDRIEAGIAGGIRQD